MSNTSVPLDKLIAISTSLLKVGESLPYDLYNARGSLISAKNYKFKNDMEISMVSHAKPMRLKTEIDESGESETPATNEGDYSSVEAKPTGEVLNTSQTTISVIGLINQLIDMFPKLYLAFNENPALAADLLNQMQKMLFRIISQDIDAAVGMIHISEIKSQSEHCVFSAILASIYAKTIGYPDRYIRLVATSALCMNLGAIKLHQQLNSEDSALSEAQISEIRQHSQASVALMESADIRHPTIINGILHHHERPDGEGYPAGLHSHEIPDEALIIGIVDTYLSMIGPRAYRKKIQSRDALKQVLFEGHKYDKDFYNSFIKAIGVFPAGTFHKLDTGEVVLVTRRDPAHATRPEIRPLMDANGVKIKQFKLSRLAETKQRIKAPYSGGRRLQINPIDIWKK